MADYNGIVQSLFGVFHRTVDVAWIYIQKPFIWWFNAHIGIRITGMVMLISLALIIAAAVWNKRHLYNTRY